MASMIKTAPITILPVPPDPPARMGLIGAGGRLPIMVATGMREMGYSVHCVGLRGAYDPDLPGLCDEFTVASPLRLGSWCRALRRFRVGHAVMVGRIDKAAFAYNWWTILRNTPDLRAAKIWLGLRGDRRSHRLLASVAVELARDGVQLIDSTVPIQSHMATAGVMTLQQPTSAQRTDIEFGWPILLEMLRLDIGQAIAVRAGDVIAVEAVEGTDRMIERAGRLCRGGGWTLMKGARAGHDRRADVPTIGPDTIKALAQAGGKCIAVSAGDVIIVDKPETVALADKLGVAIVGVHPV